VQTSGVASLAEAATARPRLSDEALVERTLAGEMRAFEELVERHRGVVYRVAARIAGQHDADDVAQDAFLRAFHRLPRFRRESPFRGWLLRITHNAALDAIARRKRSTLDAGADAEHPSIEGGAVRTPAQHLEETERRDRLAAKLQLMKPAHRAVLVLRDLEGLSYEEIAAVTDAPLGSVKGRLHRARAELIEILRRNTYDWELPR
jgi:RNA polymerase sigma-70 factor (ECF subfamily)